MPFTPEMRELVEQSMAELNGEEAQTEGEEAQASTSEVQDPPVEEEAIEPETEVEEPDGTETEVEDPETPEPETTEEEVPTHYYGMDLSEFPEDVRKDIIKEAKAQDQYLNSLQRENAEQAGELSQLRETVTQLAQTVQQIQAGGQAPVEQEEEPSDDDYLALMGLDPEDEVDQLIGQKMLPLVKDLVAVKKQLSTQQETDDAQSFEAWATHWNSELDRLEQEQGPLPMTRDDFIDFCMEKQLVDPVAAYKAVTEPMRDAAIKAALKAKSETLREQKKSASTTRPRGAGGTSPKDRKDLTVEEAMRLAEEKVGVSLDTALAESEF